MKVNSVGEQEGKWAENIKQVILKLSKAQESLEAVGITISEPEAMITERGRQELYQVEIGGSDYPRHTSPDLLTLETLAGFSSAPGPAYQCPRKPTRVSIVLRGCVSACPYTLHHLCHNLGPGMPSAEDETGCELPPPQKRLEQRCALAKVGVKHGGDAASKSIVCTSSGDEGETFCTEFSRETKHHRGFWAQMLSFPAATPFSGVLNSFISCLSFLQ